MLNKIRAYFLTKRKKETIAKLVEIKANFYKANVEYSRNLNELYNVLCNTQISVIDDISRLREVDVNTMFETSYNACEFVLDIVDEGVNVPDFLFRNEYVDSTYRYLDWRVNNFSMEELAKLYLRYIYLLRLYRKNKEGTLSLDEVRDYNKLSTNQLEFLKGSLSVRLRDEAIRFYILMLEIELGND